VVERGSDGGLTLAPDTSLAAIRKRHGLEPATLAEFEAKHGSVLPPDGEGHVDAILARHGATPLSAEEFERHFGDLPTDDEG